MLFICLHDRLILVSSVYPQRKRLLQWVEALIDESTPFVNKDKLFLSFEEPNNVIAWSYIRLFVLAYKSDDRIRIQGIIATLFGAYIILFPVLLWGIIVKYDNAITNMHILAMSALVFTIGAGIVSVKIYTLVGLIKHCSGHCMYTTFMTL